MTTKFYPSNHGSLWSNTEENKLLDLIKDYDDCIDHLDKVSLVMNRSPRSLLLHLRTMAWKLYDEDKQSFDQVCLQIKLSKQDIKAYFINKKTEKKVNEQTNVDVRNTTQFKKLEKELKDTKNYAQEMQRDMKKLKRSIQELQNRSPRIVAGRGLNSDDENATDLLLSLSD